MEELLRILEKNARMPIEDIAAMLDNEVVGTQLSIRRNC